MATLYKALKVYQIKDILNNILPGIIGQTLYLLEASGLHFITQGGDILILNNKIQYKIRETARNQNFIFPKPPP